MTPVLGAGPAPPELGWKASLFDEVASGLQSTPKRLPEKLLYDHRGAELFERITRLEAYYPTRTEIRILELCMHEVADSVGPSARVVEFGSGSGRKTSLLLDALERPELCVPIDIAELQLFAFAERLQAEYVDMRVVPLVADYTLPFRLPPAVDSSVPDAGELLFFFPGSTIGNLEPEMAVKFLRQVGSSGGAGCSFLIGVDLVKDRESLQRAYDDPEGVTAEFNRNVLFHLNELYDGDLIPDAFEHRAVWNPQLSRIEMRLVSSVHQEATLQGGSNGAESLRVRFNRGEEVVTEHSYKYTPDGFESLCAEAGWSAVRHWSDERQWFAVYYLQWEHDPDERT